MTYEYLCTSCGHAWEAEQSISAAALKTCPNCQKDTAKRQVSGGAGFILKGGGWYADLYGSAPKKSPDAKSDAKDGAKSDGAAKPDAGSSSKSTESGSSGSSGSSSSSGSSGGGSSGGGGGSSGGGSTTGTPSAA
jgi:putative FmdB family regulatory protein